MKFDMTFLNGNIYTMEREGSRVEALGIKDGLIVFTGSNKEAALYESEQVIDLQGKTVIPGMADSHMHTARTRQRLIWQGPKALKRW